MNDILGSQVHTTSNGGFMTKILTKKCVLFVCIGLTLLSACQFTEAEPSITSSLYSYTVVGTNMSKYYNNSGEISAPSAGQSFYGQDAQYKGNTPSYTDNGDGTITDNVTGLMWVKERGDRITWATAVAGASQNKTGNYSDWRMPTIKELYSLIQFSGVNGSDVYSTTGYIPYIDSNYFGFTYGSGISPERVIDAQDWSDNKYISTTMNGDETIFGVNFADGRIKGYPQYTMGTGVKIENTLFVRYVRGTTTYGTNAFVNNGDGTISDTATNLMWSESDSASGLNWQEALAWVQTKNNETYLGHNDWRLPDAKELQSIVDYNRCPDITASPAIDSMFKTTSITNENNQSDYPYFWTSSILLDGGPTPSGIYISFGRAMGYMNGVWMDVHGAGTQKSDILTGDPSLYPSGRGPQGDAVRIYNYVRLVRDI